MRIGRVPMINKPLGTICPNMAGSIEVRQYESTDHERWDNFVRGSNNGTIFHEQQFLDYHPEDRFEFHHLIFEMDGNILSVLPGQLKDGVFKSPMGSSYGGFVTEDLSYDRTEEIASLFLDNCKSNGIKEIYLTHPPLIYSKTMNMNMEYALRYLGFDYKHHLYSSVINIEVLADDPLGSLPSRSKRAIRASMKKGLTLKINQDFDTYYPILVENKKKFNLPPTHTLEELHRLGQLYPDRIKVFGAYLDEKMVGGILAMLTSNDTIIAFYISMDYDHQDSRPINFCIHEITKWGIENGYRYFDLGVNQDTSSENPMELNRPLISFKSSMGARCFFRSCLHKKME